MRARRYKPSDWDMVNKWGLARGMPFVKPQWLPKNGFIVDDVAVCFLMKTDCKIGIPEYFSSNPEIADEVKLQAYDLIWAEIEKCARLLKIHELKAYSDIMKVIGVLLRYDMVSDQKTYFVFRKLLTGEDDGRAIESGASNGNTSAESSGRASLTGPVGPAETREVSGS